MPDEDKTFSGSLVLMTSGPHTQFDLNYRKGRIYITISSIRDDSI